MRPREVYRNTSGGSGVSLTRSAPGGARGTASSILVNRARFGNVKWRINAANKKAWCACVDKLVRKGPGVHP